MNSTFYVCKHKKIKNNQYYPSHIQPSITMSDIELSISDAVDVINDMNSHNRCCFIYPHITQGLILYKCWGCKEKAISIGYITDTQGFYYVVQDVTNPLRIFALARRPPSNFVFLHEYTDKNEVPQRIDLNPPPHNKKSGIYMLTYKGLKLEQHIDNLYNGIDNALLFNCELYFIDRLNLYKITLDGRLKPYNKFKHNIASIQLEVNNTELVVKIKTLNGDNIVDVLDKFK